MDIKKLDTFDLIDELQQLNGMLAYVEAHRINENNVELNHCLLDKQVNRLIGRIHHACKDFRDAVYGREAVVLKELNRRGVIDVKFGGE